MNNSTSSATGNGSDIPKTTVKTVTRKEVDGSIYSALMAIAPDDLKSITWEETVRVPEAKVRSPEHTLEEVFRGLEELYGKLEAEDKALFEAQMRTLRQILELDVKRDEY
ncbi:hypothetical protein M440DRAFT_1428290 [Trichoderma longibrachiatum ATCC 18648]|uniref:Uncharacterized protein n=1 Tax=Trichoderma longibrachiatum ATCC 18648 TaxID=983965 RepID=A0A2T4CGG7_TRILO|nr:hypothetical protein M440DRAFT_1428290 [Trichoderma longibrachiatum ATCC 18648]